MRPYASIQSLLSVLRADRGTLAARHTVLLAKYRNRPGHTQLYFPPSPVKASDARDRPTIVWTECGIVPWLCPTRSANAVFWSGALSERCSCRRPAHADARMPRARPPRSCLAHLGQWVVLVASSADCDPDALLPLPAGVPPEPQRMPRSRRSLLVPPLGACPSSRHVVTQSAMKASGLVPSRGGAQHAHVLIGMRRAHLARPCPRVHAALACAAHVI